ncbi:MAG: MBL fold metallo-hydrolase [Planctomycetota bacterium]|jgi:glyoxylase-like metal-dependent hydrolase (beta-lactamase superfamily II)
MEEGNKRMKPRIHGFNSMDILLPEDTISTLLMNAGRCPDLPEGELRVFGYDPKIKWPDGSIKPGVKMPLIIWYIENADKKILIDTGASVESADLGNKAFKVRGQGQVYIKDPDRHNIEKFLNKHGTSREEIDVIVLSHLHLDHFFNSTFYPKAKFLIQAAELPWGLSPPPYAEFHWREFVPYLEKVLDRIVILNGNIKLSRGVEVWKVGGHTPGSQVLAVETKEGRVILSGDFFYQYKNIEYSWPVGALWRMDEWIENCEMLKSKADIIIPTHDFYFWELFKDGTVG